MRRSGPLVDTHQAVMEGSGQHWEPSARQEPQAVIKPDEAERLV